MHFGLISFHFGVFFFWGVNSHARFGQFVQLPPGKSLMDHLDLRPMKAMFRWWTCCWFLSPSGKGGFLQSKQKLVEGGWTIFKQRINKNAPGNILSRKAHQKHTHTHIYIYKCLSMSKNRKDTIHIRLAEGFPGSPCVKLARLRLQVQLRTLVHMLGVPSAFQMVYLHRNQK